MERSQPISKAFTRLRRGIGGTLDEREEGARQANTDLHSLRRWFVMSAHEALLNGAQRYSRGRLRRSSATPKGRWDWK